MNTVLLPINEYLNKLENADNNQKNAIENELVNIGKEAVPSLVDSLQVVKGRTRGIVAMVLIRIGESSIDYLQKAAETFKNKITYKRKGNSRLAIYGRLYKIITL